VDVPCRFTIAISTEAESDVPKQIRAKRRTIVLDTGVAKAIS
jgi:hypothetical protein